MVEPLLSGIVLGMITVTAFGLFVAAFLQYRRGSVRSLILLKSCRLKICKVLKLNLTIF
jgi:cytochrome b6-f complex subunit 5